MRTILLIPGQLRNGGTEKHFYHLICRLDRSKFKIIVCLFDKFQNEKGEIPNDVIIELVKGNYITKSIHLLKIIFNNRVNLIYSCSFETSLPIFFSWPILFFSTVRFYTGVRGAFEFPWYRKIFEFLINHISYKIITNSNRIKEYIPSIFHKKVINIYNGIEENYSYKSNSEIRYELKINQDSRVIGCIGRLDYMKGQDILLKAFYRAFLNDENVILVLIGDGKEKDALKLMANELGLKNRVFFLGNIINASEYLSLFDLFVLPSRFESFPNALLEAIKNGLPIIASNVGGVEEIYSKINFGSLYNFDDVETLSILILKYIDSSRKVYSYKDFTLEKNINSFQNIFLD